MTKWKSYVSALPYDKERASLHPITFCHFVRDWMGICALASAWAMRLLRAQYHGMWPCAILHDRPCMPQQSTEAPEENVCYMLAPRWMPTAILIAPLLRWRIVTDCGHCWWWTFWHDNVHLSNGWNGRFVLFNHEPISCRLLSDRKCKWNSVMSVFPQLNETNIITEETLGQQIDLNTLGDTSWCQDGWSYKRWPSIFQDPIFSRESSIKPSTICQYSVGNHH